MFKKAFSMLELVFVIVVAGILAIALIPNYDRDYAGEAIYKVAEHLRLAQHNAMTQDFTTPAVNTNELLWRVGFINGSNGACYSVFTDTNGGGNADANEAAVDPMSGLLLRGTPGTCSQNNANSSEVLLWREYSIRRVTLGGGCNPAIRNIAFDNIGRPGQIIGNNFTLLAADCTVTVADAAGNSAMLNVVQETGYVDVVRINADTF